MVKKAAWALPAQPSPSGSPSARSNRPARHTDEAVEELMRCSGTQFDPAVIEAFIIAHKKGNIE